MLALFVMALLDPCAAEERKSGVEERHCFALLADQTDREMAAHWRLALNKAKREDVIARRENANRPMMVADLLASQRAWLRYREAQCAMISDQAAGGTGFGEMDSRCRIDLNRRRTADLKRRAEGFLAPPFP
jgi:uncharacterized protein YecT (DUF1311 family)